MDQPKFIGTIFSVASGGVSVILREGVMNDQARGYISNRIGKLGSYVIMPDGDISVIGTVNAVRNIDVSVPTHELELSRMNRQVMDVQLVGILRDGKFERGVSSSPMLDGSVYAADTTDLRMIFAAYRELDFSIGSISLLQDERLFLDPNKFFAKHVALFGST